MDTFVRNQLDFNIISVKPCELWMSYDKFFQTCGLDDINELKNTTKYDAVLTVLSLSALSSVTNLKHLPFDFYGIIKNGIKLLRLPFEFYERF